MAPRLSSSFGVRTHPLHKIKKHHHGIDLAAPQNTPIRAVAEGTVVFSGRFGGYGKYITIVHKGGFTSHYGHCRLLHNSLGDTVRAGQVIGTVGSTGISTGPHLHFELRKNGIALNPVKAIPGFLSKPTG